MCWEKRQTTETGPGGKSKPSEAIELETLEAQLVMSTGPGSNESMSTDQNDSESQEHNRNEHDTFIDNAHHKLHMYWKKVKESPFSQSFISDKYICRWKFCCATTCASLILFLIIFLPILIYTVIPNFADVK